MIDPKVVFEPVLGRWRVEHRTQWTDEWQTHRYHHTLEEACEVAQEMTNNDLDGAYRVVDTQPDMTTPRLSGPCSHGLPCTCDMPRTPRMPERRPQVTIPPQAVTGRPPGKMCPKHGGGANLLLPAPSSKPHSPGYKPPRTEDEQ